MIEGLRLTSAKLSRLSQNAERRTHAALSCLDAVAAGRGMSIAAHEAAAKVSVQATDLRVLGWK
jgi:hypothetical protein